MKKPIRQEDDFGCGYACVAYLLGIGYREVFQYVDNHDKAITGGYRCRFLAEALRNAGKHYKTKYIARFDNYIIPDDSIVYINKNSLYKYGHYLVKTPHGYMNPFANILEAAGDSAHAIANYQKECPGKISLIVHPI